MTEVLPEVESLATPPPCVNSGFPQVTGKLVVSDRAQKPLDMRTRIALVLPPFDFQNGGRQIKIQHVIVDAVAPLSFL